MTHSLIYILLGIQFLIAAIGWEKGNGSIESFNLAVFGVILIVNGVVKYE